MCCVPNCIHFNQTCDVATCSSPAPTHRLSRLNSILINETQNHSTYRHRAMPVWSTDPCHVMFMQHAKTRLTHVSTVTDSSVNDYMRSSTTD